MLESMHEKGWGGRACQIFITTLFQRSKEVRADAEDQPQSPGAV